MTKAYKQPRPRQPGFKFVREPPPLDAAAVTALAQRHAFMPGFNLMGSLEAVRLMWTFSKPEKGASSALPETRDIHRLFERVTHAAADLECALANLLGAGYRAQLSDGLGHAFIEAGMDDNVAAIRGTELLHCLAGDLVALARGATLASSGIIAGNRPRRMTREDVLHVELAQVFQKGTGRPAVKDCLDFIIAARKLCADMNPPADRDSFRRKVTSALKK